ncbi:MAG: phosphoethanolamine--lipid A transferase, partial [Gammaproteobacteria bacterium]|nr:phosphoethanolamine--lipid A transferase [Gammaproteobacteria bacterium]
MQTNPSTPTARRFWPGFRLTLQPELLALLASLFFTLATNSVFWSTLLEKVQPPPGQAFGLLLGTGVLVTGLNWLILLLIINRWIAKPLLILLLFVTAAAVYYMSSYGVFLDRAMIRNIFETDLREAGELLNLALLPYLIGLGLLPALLLWPIRLAQRSLRQALIWRAGSLLAACLMMVVGAWPVLDQLAPTMRNNKKLHYLITPANYLISTARFGLMQSDALAGAAQPRKIIAADAHAAAKPHRPRVFVLVVGETVRSANWGLSGYTRQTTPQLAALDVLNFPQVRSCGTDTATSVPCMFSLYGRRDYDEERIRNSQSLLHILDRVGVSVLWRDNQAGCKGVCTDLPVEDLSHNQDPKLCDGQRCYDEILLQGLSERIRSAQADTLIVLHMLGNHGPAYYQRYPEQFRRFTPTCDTRQLADCSHEALVNTYDNAILYTDHVLARLIAELKQLDGQETGLLYVSDHGESLGENNIYLHGMPNLIAPSEQTQVPLILWLSNGLSADLRLDQHCLKAEANQAISHDNLFHSLLGLFDVETQDYVPELDIIGQCRQR